MKIKSIVAWCLFDWGIAAFPVVVTTFVIAAYFTKQIAINEIVGTQQWGNALAIAGVIIAILSPILGAIADYGGQRKHWLAVFVLLLIASAALLWFAYPSPNYVYLTLICVVLGTIGLNLSMVFYNAFLPTLAPKEYIGRISGWSWGLGYFGGLMALTIALFGLIKMTPSWLDTKTLEQVRACGPLVAIWIGVFTLPFFFFVPDTSSTHLKTGEAIRQGMKGLKATLKMMWHQKTILYFLIAQMIYIDGLNTIFVFGGIYAAGTFHMNITEVLILGIYLNVCAGIGSFLLAWLDDRIGSKKTILLSLFFLSIFGLSIVLVNQKMHFWICTGLLSLFVGPVQSSSRSFMARIVPKKQATELFGFYILSGKISTFLGPALLSIVTIHFNSQRAGMGSILIFFLIGALILLFVKESIAHE